MREVGPPDTRTLEGIIPADYQQGGGGGGRYHFNMINRQTIIYFTVKKYKKKKQTNGYAAATKVLCLYLHFLPLLAVIAHYLIT